MKASLSIAMPRHDITLQKLLDFLVPARVGLNQNHRIVSGGIVNRTRGVTGLPEHNDRFEKAAIRIFVDVCEKHFGSFKRRRNSRAGGRVVRPYGIFRARRRDMWLAVFGMPSCREDAAKNANGKGGYFAIAASSKTSIPACNTTHRSTSCSESRGANR